MENGVDGGSHGECCMKAERDPRVKGQWLLPGRADPKEIGLKRSDKAPGCPR